MWSGGSICVPVLDIDASSCYWYALQESVPKTSWKWIIKWSDQGKGEAMDESDDVRMIIRRVVLPEDGASQ